MKNLIFITLSIILFTGCKQEVRYSQQSPEVETYKNVIENYKNMNFDEMAKHYADTAKIANNVTEKKAINIW